MSERLVVGRVAKAHGIRGEVSVEVLTERPDRFEVGAQLFADSRLLTISAARKHHGRLLISFEGISDRNQAEELHGEFLTIDEAEAAPLPEGRWYPHQLEGLRVELANGDLVGTFKEVLESKAHDIWVIETADGDALVPAAFVTGVDLDTGIITLDPPEGLL